MNFTLNARVLAAAALGSVIAGCVTYAPDPIDWRHEQESWSPDAAPLTLTLGDLQLLAAAMNPDLNRLRLRHANLKHDARAAGWWEDPALDVDIARLLESSTKPWTIGGALTFTIPLTGIPGLERKAAEAYAEAGWFDVAFAEKKLAADVHAAWVELAATERLLALRQAFAEETRAMLQQAEHLDRLGECPPEQTGMIRKAAADAQTVLVATRIALPQKRAELLELAGIHPLQRVQLKGLDVLSSGGFEWFDESDLVSHPAVQSKLMEFNATEHQFRAEIRRQFPELSLGPTVEYDQGDWKGGLSFGLTLPLWNRNRAGIAAAGGLRSEARVECLNTWRSLVYASHRLRAEIEALEHEAGIIETTLLPAARQLRDATAALDALGESDVFTRFEAVQSHTDAAALQLDLAARLTQTKLRAAGELLAIFN